MFRSDVQIHCRKSVAQLFLFWILDCVVLVHVLHVVLASLGWMLQNMLYLEGKIIVMIIVIIIVVIIISIIIIIIIIITFDEVERKPNFGLWFCRDGCSV